MTTFLAIFTFLFICALVSGAVMELYLYVRIARRWKQIPFSFNGFWSSFFTFNERLQVLVLIGSIALLSATTIPAKTDFYTTISNSSFYFFLSIWCVFFAVATFALMRNKMAIEVRNWARNLRTTKRLLCQIPYFALSAGKIARTNFANSFVIKKIERIPNSDMYAVFVCDLASLRNETTVCLQQYELEQFLGNDIVLPGYHGFFHFLMKHATITKITYELGVKNHVRYWYTTDTGEDAHYDVYGGIDDDANVVFPVLHDRVFCFDYPNIAFLFCEQLTKTEVVRVLAIGKDQLIKSFQIQVGDFFNKYKDGDSSLADAIVMVEKV